MTGPHINNLLALAKSLPDHGEYLTSAALAEAWGVAKATVYVYLDELQAAGVHVEVKRIKVLRRDGAVTTVPGYRFEQEGKKRARKNAKRG